MSQADAESIIMASPLRSQLEQSSRFKGKHGRLSRFIAEQWAYALDNDRRGDGGPQAEAVREQAGELIRRVLVEAVLTTAQRRLAIALAFEVIRRGETSFECTARYAAGMIGSTDAKGVNRDLWELHSLGLVVRTPGTTDRAPHTVKVVLTWELVKIPTSRYGRIELVGNLATERLRPHDVFTSPKGPGTVAGWVWALWSDGDRPGPEVRDALELPVRSFNRAVAKLLKAGVQHDSDLDVVAEHLGITGHLERCRAKFTAEREDYREGKADWIKRQLAEQDDEFTGISAQLAAQAQKQMADALALGPPRVDPFEGSTHMVDPFEGASWDVNAEPSWAAEIPAPWADPVIGELSEELRNMLHHKGLA